MEAISIPCLFRCPISLEVMKDPVILTTGVTYDRESIQRWFQEGHFTCPSTMQALNTLELTPNHTLKRLIQAWCSSNHSSENISSMELTDRKQTEQVLHSVGNAPTKLGNLRDLADFAKKSETNRSSIGESGGISVLISSMCRARKEGEIICGEEALSILASLPLDEAQAECIRTLKSPITIDTICWLLCKGSYRARLNAAQVLHGLLTSDQNFKAVFRPDEETFENLASLLRDVCPHAIKAALDILLIISPLRRNRIRAVEAGVCVAVIEMLPEADRNMAEKAMVLLEILCQSAEGRASVCGHPMGIPVLVKKIARVSDLATEAATGSLWYIFKNCRIPSVLQDMEEAGAYSKLFLLLQVGCSSITRHRTKEILRSHKCRSWKVNPCCIPTDQVHEAFKYQRDRCS